MTQADFAPLPLPDMKGLSRDEQAESWLAYLYSGMSSPAGEDSFSHWLSQSEQNEAAYRRAEQGWRDIDLVFDSTVVPVRNPKRKRYWPYILSAVAMSVAVIFSVWTVMLPPPPPAEQYYSSPLGKTRVVNLADGSTVTLGAASSLVVSFSDTARYVELVEGGAYFDVATDPTRIFSVRAKSTEVQVVGTEFEVSSSKSGIQIAVARGMVDVTTHPPASAEELPTLPIRKRAAVHLSRGQKIFAEAKGTLGPIEDFNVENAFSWRLGRLNYQGTPLSFVVAEINRYRQDKIFLANDSLGRIKITMSMATDQTDLLLSGLELSYPVVIESIPTGILVREKSRDSL